MGQEAIRVECQDGDCEYSEVVHPEDDVLAIDLYLEHGDETGHDVTVIPIETE